MPVVARSMQVRRMIVCVITCTVVAITVGYLLYFTAGPRAAKSGVVSYVGVPGKPFSAIASKGGRWAFVSLAGSSQGGIGILHRASGQWAFVRTVPCGAVAFGLTLTHDGKLLIAAARDNVAFFDVSKLVSGQPGALLGYLSDGKRAGSVYDAVSPDDRFAFVSDEFANTVTVVNLDMVRRAGPSSSAIVGRIPVGLHPVGLAFSPDGRYLYSTSLMAPASYGWPTMPNAEDQEAGASAQIEGPLLVIDVKIAQTDPVDAVVGKVPVGYCPVRLALSPDGNTAYVAARNTNTVNVFDTRKFLTDPSHAEIAVVPVGAAPVGIIVVKGGKRLVVADSNRYFAKNRCQTLTVIDATDVSSGHLAVRETIPTGAFPRELNVTPDGKTLLVTNYNSGTVEFINLTHLP